MVCSRSHRANVILNKNFKILIAVSVISYTMSDINKLKQKILIASRVLYAPNGITNVEVGLSGHVSGRLPGEDTYLVIGHIHAEGRSHLGDADYDDLVTVDVKTGQKISGTRDLVEESIIHTAIYRARSDVNSIIHVHPFWCGVWSLTEKQVMDVPVLVTGRFLITSEQDGKDLVNTLGDGNAILHPGHGVVVVGETVERACASTITLEDLAKKLFCASLLGSIPKPHLEVILRGKRGSSQNWPWYEAKLKEKGIYPNLPKRK